MASFAATATLDGNDYDVISCVYSFGQATDEKGRPASIVHSGSISLQLDGGEDSKLQALMIDPYKKFGGTIAYKKIDEDATLKELKFEDAYCVGLSESLSSGRFTTSINIAARKITIGDATHEEKW